MKKGYIHRILSFILAAAGILSASSFSLVLSSATEETTSVESTTVPETTTAPETTTVPEATTVPETTTEEPTTEESTTKPVDKRKPLGDVDGDGAVTSDDARALLRYSVALDKIDDKYLPYADMNSDKAINSQDARLALRTSVSLEKEVKHLFVNVKGTASTCREKGTVSFSCSECKKSFTILLPEKKHTLQTVSKTNPTCTAVGKLTEKCSVCGFIKEKVYSPLGHKWVSATATTPKNCSVCKIKITGWTEIGDKTYYFNPDGTITAGDSVLNTAYNGVTASWYLKNGELLKSFRGALNIGGTDYIITEGKAQKVVTEADKTLFRAYKAVEKATTPDMTKEQKLKACFDYCKREYYEYRPRTPHYKGMDWPIVYANDMFIVGGGNCLSYGAAFAYMAKAIGYEEVYCCHSGGHGWAEIDGLIYDPEWSLHHSAHTFFALSYDVVYGGQNYKAAISPGYDWMRIKI